MRITLQTDLGTLGCGFPILLVTFPSGRLGGYLHGVNWGLDKYCWIVSPIRNGDRPTMLYTEAMELSECKRFVMQI